MLCVNTKENTKNKNITKIVEKIPKCMKSPSLFFSSFIIAQVHCIIKKYRKEKRVNRKKALQSSNLLYT